MDNAYDLTTGKVSQKLIGFFFPLLLANLMQQIYSVADTAIVGKGLGDNALAAVGNLSSLSLLIIGFSMGMTNGFSVITAQNYGSGDTEALRRSVSGSVRLSALMSALLTTAGCILLRPVLDIMQTDEILIADGLKYGYIILGGLTVTVAYNLFSGLLRSLGDSKTPFFAVMISSAVNIALDCLLIFIFHTGVEGAAAATVAAQGLSALICLIKLRRSHVMNYEKNISIDSDTYILLLKNGLPMACMNSVTAVGCMVVQGYVNGCGAAFTAAYSVCSKYLNLFMLPSLTAGFAVSAFVGQNYGAGKKDRIRQGVKVGNVIAFISYMLIGGTAVLLPSQLAGAMLNESNTICMAAGFLRICGVELILLNLLFIYRNAVQGMGRPFIPMLSGIAEMVLRIPAIIILLPLIGFKATGFAEGIAWTGALGLNFAAYMIYRQK